MRPEKRSPAVCLRVGTLSLACSRYLAPVNGAGEAPAPEIGEAVWMRQVLSQKIGCDRVHVPLRTGCLLFETCYASFGRPLFRRLPAGSTVVVACSPPESIGQLAMVPFGALARPAQVTYGVCCRVAE